jgi:hypothetical protein
MSCEPSQTYNVLYDVGSKVYIKKKAKKGIIEYVFIKKFQFNGLPPGTLVYVDMFNRVWLERELITQSQAVELALSFWNKRLDELSFKANLSIRCAVAANATLTEA